MQELTDADVSIVIVGPLRYRTEMIELFTDLLGRPPIETGGVQLWRDVQGSAAPLTARRRRRRGAARRTKREAPGNPGASRVLGQVPDGTAASPASWPAKGPGR